MELHTRHRQIRFPRRPLLMGILNITDDSFSGDGRLDPAWAQERAREMVAQGADMVDVGGESARTNRPAISPDEELRRILPFIEAFSEFTAGTEPRDEEQIFPPLLSINTWRPEVAGPALRAGGDILNDMGGLPDDRNAHLCAETGAALLIMHSVGEPKQPHTHVGYDNVMTTMRAFFREKIALAERAGLPREAIILDPGIDFAKQQTDNLRVYRDLDTLQEFGRPLLLPVSRKGVVGAVLDQPDPADRDAGTAACVVAAMLRGGAIFRVHNLEMGWRTISSVHRLLTA